MFDTAASILVSKLQLGNVNRTGSSSFMQNYPITPAYPKAKLWVADFPSAAAEMPGIPKLELGNETK